jgi:hypothetical protein
MQIEIPTPRLLSLAAPEQRHVKPQGLPFSYSGTLVAVPILPREEKSTRSKEFEETMKTTEESQEPLWPSDEQIERLRRQLRDRIASAELESSWRLEALDRLIVLLQMEPTAFHRLWVQPLLAAGATMEVAITCITASYFLPN